MAEGFLRKTCGEQFDALSVGLEPGTLNPVVVRTMSEVGIDISGNETQSVGDILTRGESFDHVITVCDEANATRWSRTAMVRISSSLGVSESLCTSGK
jgi:arsenate reductase